MAKSARWIVTLADPGKIAQIERDLREAGFKVADVMGEVGVITGTADEAAARKARRIRGVADVSPETQIDIGRPGSPDTW